MNSSEVDLKVQGLKTRIKEPGPQWERDYKALVGKVKTGTDSQLRVSQMDGLHRLVIFRAKSIRQHGAAVCNR